MKCVDTKCEFRELNGGDGISDFYFCRYCGISVERGQDECLLDEWRNADMRKKVE